MARTDRVVTVRVPRRGTVQGRYTVGGVYVDLFFGYSDSPYTTIRVWDDHTQQAEIGGSLADVRRVVTSWVEDMDSDVGWPTWYEDILAASQA